jgi:hypothetical protein
LARKLLLAALIFVAVGLVLLIYPDPQFRLIFSGAGARGFPTTGFTFTGNRTGAGGFPRGNFTRPAGTGVGAVLGFNAVSIIESLLGVGLVGVGAVLIAIELFMMPARIK